jgi:hypothetical protein
MAEHGSKLKELTSAQRKAIPHLLACRNVETAARASGISERTLYRWLADDYFYSAVASAEGDAIDYAVRRLVKLADKAIDTIEAVLDDAKAPPSVRLRAALGALDQLTALRDVRSLEVRLMALEAIYATESKH